MTTAKAIGQMVIIKDSSGKVLERVLADGPNPKQSAMAALRKLTNNGLDLYVALNDIAMGTPHIVRLADGRETQPIVPSPDTRRQAIKDLLEFMFGKAVPQTEVVKAEEQRQEMDQLASMSDSQVSQLAAAWLEAQEKRKALGKPPSEPAKSDEG